MPVGETQLRRRAGCGVPVPAADGAEGRHTAAYAGSPLRGCVMVADGGVSELREQSGMIWNIPNDGV